jgi:pseudouridine 5'-phosphatase
MYTQEMMPNIRTHDEPSSIRGQFSCVVFDLDGLLVDTEPIFAEAARRLLASRGLELSIESLQPMIGSPARQALRSFREYYGLADSVESLMEESSQLFYSVIGESPPALLPGVLELLDVLEANATPKAIATSSRFTHLERMLGPHKLLSRFGFSLTADDVRLGKPDPEIYRKAASRFDCPTNEMLVFEDSTNGLRAAKAAGASCVVVPHALVPMEALTEADLIVPSLASLRLRQYLGF